MITIQDMQHTIPIERNINLKIAHSKVKMHQMKIAIPNNWKCQPCQTNISWSSDTCMFTSRHL